MPLLDPAHYWHISRLLSCCSGHEIEAELSREYCCCYVRWPAAGTPRSPHTLHNYCFIKDTTICITAQIKPISSITWYIYLEHYKIPPVGCAAAVAGVQGDWAGQCDRVSGDLAWPGRGARSSLLQTPSPSGTQPWYINTAIILIYNQINWYLT